MSAEGKARSKEEETVTRTDDSKAGSEEMRDVDQIRRALIRAGWVLPVVLALELKRPSTAFAQYGPPCLAGATRIDTPRGPTAVRDFRVGMVVWTVDRSGNRHPAPILRTAKTPVPVHHEMVDLVLEDGCELIASPGHPTVDGRVLGMLSVGDSLDGRRIVSVKRIPYGEAYTYDILPAGESGAYWADGILIAGTLFDDQAEYAVSGAGKNARPGAD